MGIARLAISCGGTGGHFNPGLSVARELANQGGEPVLLLGGIHSESQAETAKKFGISSLRISAAPLPRGPFSAVKFTLATISGYRSSKTLLKAFKPEALLAMGSFASLPPVLASKSLGIPIFLHDGNAKLGKANKMLSRWAKALALSFPASGGASDCDCPTILTGMPLRQEICGPQIGREEAIAFINSAFDASFDPARPLLLAFGGSLGAETINKGVPKALMTMAEPPQTIHLAGPNRASEVRRLYEGVKAKSLVMDSCYDMARLFPAADFVVCRSGGSTVSELAVFGKRALLLPYPYAAESHQDDNAAWLAASGAAIVMKDRDYSPERMAEIFGKWLNDPSENARLGARGRAIAMPYASAKVLEMISNIATLKQGRG